MSESKTPRTDKRLECISIENEDSCCAIYVKIEGNLSECGLIDVDFTRSLEAESNMLLDALKELRDACKENPAMNHERYDWLGIKVLKAITAAEKAREL